MSMAVIRWTLCLVMLIIGAVFSTSVESNEVGTNQEMDVGNWSVGDCIIAEFAMEFSIHTENDKGNSTQIDLPPSAVAEKDNKGSLCSKDVGKEQILKLSWKENQKNNTNIQLERFVTVSFSRMPNATYYGVSRLYGEFVLGYYNETVTNKTSGKNHTVQHHSTLTIDSKVNKKLMFHTPDDRSYLCANVGEVSLLAQMQWDYNKTAPHDVHNTTVRATHVQFDAFRNIPKSVPTGFRTPIDCDYQPNDIVPIAVGVALAALVVAVLIAYMVGRRSRNRAGYQSI